MLVIEGAVTRSRSAEGGDRAAAVHAQVGEHRQLRVAHRVGGAGAAEAAGQPERGHAKVCGGEVE